METPLGFFAAALIVSSVVLGGLAVALPRFQGRLVVALVVVLIGLPLLVAYLAFAQAIPLDGVRSGEWRRRIADGCQKQGTGRHR